MRDLQRQFSVVRSLPPLAGLPAGRGQYAMNHRSIRKWHTTGAIDTPCRAEMRKRHMRRMLSAYTDTAQDPRAISRGDPAAAHLTSIRMTGFQEVVEMRFEMSYPWRSHLMSQATTFADYETSFRPVSPTGARAKDQ